jgi:hypothetical protein
MRARLMACDGAFRAFDRVLSTKWQHVSAMAAPIGRHVGIATETMGDSVIDLFLVSLL